MVSTRPAKDTAKKRDTPKKKTRCRPEPCPQCGGLECFQRPRFFCGQLLTDKDLDAAQRYVIEKNRLHNRYLVGTGVVCGLAVRCHPNCEGVVVVEPGYAIDCCGNDIVLCDAAEFDVVDYLDKCRREEPPDCDGKIRARPTRCDEAPKEYCLIVSYAEESARPITALVRNNGCNTTACEPSRTNEIFRFDLVDAEDAKARRTAGFWEKAVACVRDVYPRLRQFSTEITTASKSLDENPQKFHADVFAIFCRMRAFVVERARCGPDVRCTLEEDLRRIEDGFPAFTADPERRTEYRRAVYGTIFAMYSYLIRTLIDCICDATLIPCTECDDEGVLLACLTVKDGKIISICNTVRRQIVTGPALGYWLGPLSTAIRDLMTFLCCAFDPNDFFGRLLQPRVVGFDSVDAALNRSDALFSMGRTFATEAKRRVQVADVLQFARPQVLTAMDLYDRPVGEVRAELGKQNVEVSEIRVNTEAEAYEPRHLAAMLWTVPPGGRVDVIVSPSGRVTGIKARRGGEA